MLLLWIFSASILNSLVGVVYGIFIIQAQVHHAPWTRLTGLVATIKASAPLEASLI